MEKGIIEQLDEIKEQQLIVSLQRNVISREQAILGTEIDLFNELKKDLLKDVEQKIWQLVSFFVKVWKLKY